MRDRPLVALTGLSAVTSFTGPAFFTLLLPLYARQEYGSAIAEPLPRRATFGLAFIACGVLLLPLLWAPPLAVGAAAIMASAVAFGPANPLRLTVQQDRTPTALRSRVFGTTNAVAFLASPLGALAFGELAATRGTVVAIAVNLSIFGCVGLATGVLPAFRLMDVSTRSIPSPGMASG